MTAEAMTSILTETNIGEGVKWHGNIVQSDAK